MCARCGRAASIRCASWSATKASEARDRFNEITVDVMPRSRAVRAMKWMFRAYDDGVAFRYVVPADAGLKTLSVHSEDTEFTFGADYDCHGLQRGARRFQPRR